MVRAQLQKDVTEQASLVNENAVREAESTESTTTDAEEALRGWQPKPESIVPTTLPASPGGSTAELLLAETSCMLKN